MVLPSALTHLLKQVSLWVIGSHCGVRVGKIDKEYRNLDSNASAIRLSGGAFFQSLSLGWVCE